MRDIRELRDRKKELGYTNQEISDLSGVPLGTVQEIFSGEAKSQSGAALLTIEEVLFPSETTYTDSRGTEMDVLRERPLYRTDIDEQSSTSGQENPPAGGYTYADYAALPDDRRVELIDGKFYDMAAPNSRHQIIIGQLHLQFHECVKNHPGCMVLLSPMDVMLDLDDRTVVQPDIMLLCDRSKMRKGRIFGAPDLVVEVISPGSRHMDYGRKAYKYINAGVREYWIIDYKRRKVAVYDIEHGVQLSLMGMDEDIPIHISDGACRIRMKEILDLLDGLGDI